MTRANASTARTPIFAKSIDPVLTFSTKRKRRPFKVDGKTYELLDPAELTIGARKTVETLAPQIGALMESSDEITAANETNLDKWTLRCARLISTAGAASLRRLTAFDRARLLAAFLGMKNG